MRCRVPLYLFGIPKRSRFEKIIEGIYFGMLGAIGVATLGLVGTVIYGKIKAPKPRPQIYRDFNFDAVEYKILQRRVPKDYRREAEILYGLTAFAIGGIGGLLGGKIYDKIKTPKQRPSIRRDVNGGRIEDKIL